MREIKFRAYDEETIMQFVGVKDKNGVDIYEGDIVTNPEYYFDKGIVEFCENKFVVRVGNIMINDRWWENCVVIGNIYQNTELLEGRK